MKSTNQAADPLKGTASLLQTAILLVLLFAASLIAADWFSGGVLTGRQGRGLAEAGVLGGTAGAGTQSSGW